MKGWQIVLIVVSGVCVVTFGACCIVPMFVTSRQPPGAAQNNNPAQSVPQELASEKRIREALAYLDEFPNEIRWHVIGGNDVYIGFAMKPEGVPVDADWEFVTAGAAVNGSKARGNMRFRAWAVDGDNTSREAFDPRGSFRYFNCAHADEGRVERWELDR